MKNILSLLCTITIIASLAGCSGWRVRGAEFTGGEGVLNHRFAVRGDSPALRAALSRQIALSALSKAESADNIVTIKITDEQYRRRTMSIGFEEQAAEYLLLYRAKYQLILNGDNFFDEQEIQLERNYLNDVENPAATDNEAAILLEEARTEAAVRILERTLQQLRTDP